VQVRIRSRIADHLITSLVRTCPRVRGWTKWLLQIDHWTLQTLMHGALQTPTRERNILGATLISISYVLSRPRVSFYRCEKASRVPRSMVNSDPPTLSDPARSELFTRKCSGLPTRNTRRHGCGPTHTHQGRLSGKHPRTPL
jgi:hypothetical protein